MSNSLQRHGLQPARLLCPWDSPGKSTEMGGHFLLHGIFLTQGSNPHLSRLLHQQAGSIPLVPPGKPPGIPQTKFISTFRDFPGGPVVQHCTPKVGGTGWENKIPHHRKWPKGNKTKPKIPLLLRHFCCRFFQINRT